MPRGYRRTILTLVGFVAAGLLVGYGLAVLLWPGTPSLPDYGWQETATSGYQPGGRSCEPAQIRALRTNAERASKSEACEQAAEQHRLDTNDLIQQTRAANAATEAVWIAEWQSKATVFGLIVGFFTLAAATAAAIFAKQAADETRRSAEAAESAVAVTQRIGEAQVRCYMSMTSAVIGVAENGLITIQPVMKNYGQSPAKEFRWRYRVNCRNLGESEFDWTSPKTDIDREVAGATFAAGEGYALTAIEIGLFMDHAKGDPFRACEQWMFQVRFEAEWQDVFGVTLTDMFYRDATTKVQYGVPISLKPWQGMEPSPQDSDA